MSAYSRNQQLAAYHSVAVHGGVAQDDPHRLVLMLLDGAQQRIQAARGCLQRGDRAQKAQMLQRALAIIDELRASLDAQGGGALAHNLSDLYEYMGRQLIRANAEDRSACLDEVLALLAEIRSAWVAIAPDPARGAHVAPAARTG
ncbi:MAG: flagellar export chaperone FliS [Gammaproteobacteria bacterium]|nr:flagellar export chaperone FliS [Gammaproteobacteria bacterium]